MRLDVLKAQIIQQTDEGDFSKLGEKLVQAQGNGLMKGIKGKR